MSFEELPDIGLLEAPKIFVLIRTAIPILCALIFIFKFAVSRPFKPEESKSESAFLTFYAFDKKAFIFLGVTTLLMIPFAFLTETQNHPNYTMMVFDVLFPFIGWCLILFICWARRARTMNLYKYRTKAKYDKNYYES